MSSEFSRAIGEQLRWLRKEQGLTQAEISRRTGLSRPVIARIERAKHDHLLITVWRYAAALGMDPVRDVIAIAEQIVEDRGKKCC